MALHSDLPIYAAARDLWRLVAGVVAQMRRDYKFTLGRQMEEAAFDLVMDVFRANTAEDKLPVLERMREKVIEVELRMRLAVDEDCMPRKRHARAMQLSESVARQLTGWIRDTRERQQPGRHGGRDRANDDLVAPLGHEPTAMRARGTAGSSRQASRSFPAEARASAGRRR